MSTDHDDSEPLLAPSSGEDRGRLAGFLKRLHGESDRQEKDESEEGQLYRRLQHEQLLMREKAVLALPAALKTFAAEPVLQQHAQGGTPVQLTLQLRQPDGRPLTGVTYRLVAAETDKGEVEAPPVAVRRVLSDGSAVVQLPEAWQHLDVRGIVVGITGREGLYKHKVPLPRKSADGQTLPVTVQRPIDPLALDVWAELARMADGLGDSAPEAKPEPLRPEVALGEGECGMVFRTDPSRDSHAFGVLFRLTDPALSLKTLALFPDDKAKYRAGRAVYATSNANAPGMHAVDRVAIDRPISTEAFRQQLSGIASPRQLPLAATLAIGYVVTLAQRWTQSGLALGDLVYSLPLAPGEQQRIAVMERRETASVMEREAMAQREDIRFDETDTSTVQATFTAGYSEAASGGSEYQSSAESFSTAHATGGGGVFPFGAFGGGGSISFGSSSAQGSTGTWMQGARNSTTVATQNTMAAVNRRAQAVRSASRTSVRLASATETTQVTTKVITNHNKTRALTMQYWEVLRLFDVSTVVQDVNLVCLVPLDVIDFLPAHQPARLGKNALGRDALLTRYAKLLLHADALMVEVPWRLRKGLQALTDFVADPRADVQEPAGAALTTLRVTVTGGLHAHDRVSVQLLYRRGMRSATHALPATGAEPPTGSSAFTEEAELIHWLQAQRRGHQSAQVDIVLPESVGLHDVAGVSVTQACREMHYVYAPNIKKALEAVQGVNPGDILKALNNAVDLKTRSHTHPAQWVDRHSGDLAVSVEATIGTEDSAPTLASVASTIVPGHGLVVPANRQAPRLSYDALLEIEKTLQWVLRHTMRCSKRVIASMTPEERTILLERYSVTPPLMGENGQVQEGVSLLSCVTNKVLGFYGNAIVMPFQVPAALYDDEKMSSARIEQALKRFHMQGFDHRATTIALPTRGVLGEAVLGRCPSAEKIDLTRFWNWQDSPGEQATEIGPIQLPSGNSAAGLQAPNALGAAAPIINNFSTSGSGADSALAAAIAQRAVEFGQPFDANALTNAGNLKGVLTTTIETAESARRDALTAAKEITLKAMSVAGGSPGGGGGGNKPAAPTPAPSPAPGPGPSPGGGGGGVPAPVPPVDPQPPPAPVPAPAPAPANLSIYFNKNSAELLDVTQEGIGQAQHEKLDAFAQAVTAYAEAHGTLRIEVLGYVSPEGSERRNQVLIRERAQVVTNALQARLSHPGITLLPPRLGGWAQDQDEGGNDNPTFPRMRRADARVAD
ncbi:MAG: hypothetical protein Q4G71_15095 [Pseudomonadota bacterium]|nr:hypothetical protein [Pseudomonadota bacterium]